MIGVFIPMYRYILDLKLRIISLKKTSRRFDDSKSSRLSNGKSKKKTFHNHPTIVPWRQDPVLEKEGYGKLAYK